jgi:hypothetical protein
MWSPRAIISCGVDAIPATEPQIIFLTSSFCSFDAKRYCTFIETLIPVLCSLLNQNQMLPLNVTVYSIVRIDGNNLVVYLVMLHLLESFWQLFFQLK